MVYVTGDLHGYFGRVLRFCDARATSPRDVLVVLGDAGVDFWGDASDLRARRALGGAALTVLCVHGNHEARPSPALGYERRPWRGGFVWVDPACPRLLFAEDGSVFDLEGASCLVAGGAYSVDRDFRLADGRPWFADEQPGPAERASVERACEGRGWQVDYVFTHTAPLGLRPAGAACARRCSQGADLSCEEWLAAIERRLAYRRWFCGHFHVDEHEGRLAALHRDVVELASGRTVYGAAADAAALAAGARLGTFPPRHTNRPARPGPTMQGELPCL